MGTVKLLDCTLRDGGYINDWDFSKELYDAVSTRLQTAGVDIIELGIMGNHSSSHFKTKYRSTDEVILPPRQEGSHSLFAVMTTDTEYERTHIGPYSAGQTVDAVRVAFFKPTWRKAIRQVGELLDKGYKAFAQPMATFQYSDSELLELVGEINCVHPTAFYIVDSFGTFFSEDVQRLGRLVNDSLDSGIRFGLHAHNNLQMANANAVAFINECRGRDLVVDASIYGMGRGAGNAQTEVLMHYLNRTEKRYDVDIVWELYTEFFADLRKQYSWGYLPEQYLVSFYKTNPAYVWYLGQKGITDFQDIKRVLEQIPVEKRYTLFRDIADKAIEKSAV